MRYLNIILIIIAINLSATLINMTGMIPDTHYRLDTLETIDTDTGHIIENNASLAYKIQTFAGDRYYLNQGIQSDNLQYLQAGGDFILGFRYFYEVFIKGTILVSPTLRMFGVDQNLTFIFDTIVMFAYAIAAIQFISGRQIEPAYT